MLVDDIRKLNSVETVIETKRVSLDLSASGDDDLNSVISETMINANIIWNRKKEVMMNRIHVRIQEESDEITRNTAVMAACRDSVEKYDAIVTLNQRLMKENQMLKKILDINMQILTCQKNLEGSIEKLTRLSRRMNMGGYRGDISENSSVSLCLQSVRRF